MKYRNIAGQVFGKLIAVHIDMDNNSRLTKWVCQCDCGGTTSVFMANLVRGNTRSCGCQQTAHFTKHSMYGTKVYRVWGSMIQRCTNPNDPHFDRYGGRGIQVSDDWRDFACFYRDMGEPNGLTLERINNDLGYSKENCCWATRKDQTRNRHNTVTYLFNGENLTLDEIAKQVGLSKELIRGRLRRGWALEKAAK